MVRRRSRVRFRNGALQLKDKIRKKAEENLEARVGPNGPRTGHRQVSQSHSDEVTAAGFRGLSRAVRDIPELFITLANGAVS
jgi:hypothetical protein